MRSKLTIVAIVLVVVLGALAIRFGFVRRLGIGAGLLLGFGLAAVTPAVCRLRLRSARPRQRAAHRDPGRDLLRSDRGGGLVEATTTLQHASSRASQAADPSTPAAVDLYWLPLGAGDHVVKHAGRVYEALVAARERRHRCDLYHAALEVHLDGSRYVLESAPAWDRAAPDRGVVAEGPVFLALLGNSKWFRYEVRRWRNGVIPDASAAVDGPRRIATDRCRARRTLDLAPHFPTHTWGRDELHVGDMWNSNSLIAWLLVSSGHDVEAISPPRHGRAPGWAAGLFAARPTGTVPERSPVCAPQPHP